MEWYTQIIIHSSRTTELECLPFFVGFRYSLHGTEFLGQPINPQRMQRVRQLAISSMEALGGVGAMELRASYGTRSKYSSKDWRLLGGGKTFCFRINNA